MDLPPLATEKYLRQFFKHFPKKEQNLHLLKADSHRKDTLEKVKKILDGKFLDFLFIDADHSYEGVKWISRCIPASQIRRHYSFP